MTIELKQIIEAILFSAERPLTLKELRSIFAEAVDEETAGLTEPFRTVKEAALAAALEELKVDYDSQQRAFQLVEIAGGWRLISRGEYAPWLKKLLDETRPYRLTPPALETLAIVALRQPIARADIAAIRGVEVDGVVKTLLEKDLITIVGKSDAPGHPMLYGTTQRFLEHFGLRCLDDMPKAAELRLQAAALKTAEAKAEAARADETTSAPSEDAVAGAATEPMASPADLAQKLGGEPPDTGAHPEADDDEIEDEEDEDEYDDDDEDEDDEEEDDEDEDDDK